MTKTAEKNSEHSLFSFKAVFLTVFLIFIIGLTLSSIVQNNETKALRESSLDKAEKINTLISALSIEAIILEDAPLIETLVDQVMETYPNIMDISFFNEEGSIMAADQRANTLNESTLFTHVTNIELSGEVFGSVKITWDHSQELETINQTYMATWIISSLITLIFSVLIILFFSKTKKAFDAQNKAAQIAIEAKYIADEQNLLKSEFIANMSHELRTPLNSILGFSHIIKENPKEMLQNTSLKEYAEYIYDGGTHLLSLVNDILDISKLEAGEMTLQEETFSFTNLVHSCVSILSGDAGQKNIKLKETGDINSNILLKGDQRFCKQILLNILGNAIKFTDKGGEVSIGYEVNDIGNLVIIIQDNGIGIPTVDQKKVLEPFGQSFNNPLTTQEGTGLGLPLSVKLTALHKGWLELKSLIGEGTTVTITFPSERVSKKD